MSVINVVTAPETDLKGLRIDTLNAEWGKIHPECRFIPSLSWNPCSIKENTSIFFVVDLSVLLPAYHSRHIRYLAIETYLSIKALGRANFPTSVTQFPNNNCATSYLSPPPRALMHYPCQVLDGVVVVVVTFRHNSRGRFVPMQSGVHNLCCCRLRCQFCTASFIALSRWQLVHPAGATTCARDIGAAGGIWIPFDSC